MELIGIDKIELIPCLGIRCRKVETIWGCYSLFMILHQETYIFCQMGIANIHVCLEWFAVVGLLVLNSHELILFWLFDFGWVGWSSINPWLFYGTSVYGFTFCAYYRPFWWLCCDIKCGDCVILFCHALVEQSSFVQNNVKISLI